MELYNDDCFNVFPKIKDKSINLFLLDLPYGQTACKWDSVIDLDKMWIEIKRMMKPNGIIVFFCTAKFGNTIINSNPKWFKYDLIWKKSRKVGFLSANKMPLRQHENIYVFDNDNNDDIEITRNIELRNYAKQVYKFIGKTKTQINKILGHRRVEHFFYFKTTQFGLPTKETYDELIKDYKINEMEGFLDYEIIEALWEKEPSSTYNPQKTEGKPYKTIGSGDCEVYGAKRLDGNNTGDRHPTSIIEHENIYVFKKEQGTYNPQKTEGKPYNKTNTGNNNDDNCAYGTIDRSSHLEGDGNRKINTGDRHPTSIIEHENIYVFDNDNNDDIELTRNIELRDYAKQVYKFIGKNSKQKINKDLGHTRAEHFCCFTNSQFGLCDNETYDELIKHYKINEMEGFLDYDKLKSLWEKEPSSTYNPQKTEGKPYKCNQGKQTDLYGIEEKDQVITTNNGDRHPTSIIENTILEYNNPAKSLHRTQKPVELCEWLIKTYTNEDDIVMDFTMGSGTTGIACSNTNREFIGVEMDKEIFEIAEKRILKSLKTSLN
tara:strand:+ start:4781 stop:6418 length:1638 start_codon:yes stop_codon:yes gene_type:complete